MKISNEAANVLSNSIIKGNNLFLPNEQLERPLYMAVDKVLKAIKGKWNRKEKAHVFEYSPTDIIDEILITGEYTDSKKEFQFFETPEALAVRMVEIADIQPHETILEPSAGRGAIAKIILNRTTFGILECIELWQDNIDSLINIGLEVVAQNFLESTKVYNVIIANPPFTRQQDIDHVNHMIDCADRKVVSVMSAGVLFRTNNKTVEFRKKIKSLGGTIEPLPEGSFKKSGTNVNTCLVIIDLH